MEEQQLFEPWVRLARWSMDFLDRLGLPGEAQPLDKLLGELQPRLEELGPRELSGIARIELPKACTVAAPALGVGLNSVGLLLDRLTILLVKEWKLRHSPAADPAKAQELYWTQTLDIIAALLQARPGSSAAYSKITTLRGDAQADNWPEAYYGLFTTNLLLWESQEILYVRDIARLPAEELRSYIQWFSKGNIRRNQYIHLSEVHFWGDSH